jgi:aryl-alcohol dehydrogenase-like predicted oxidoreductase
MSSKPTYTSLGHSGLKVPRLWLGTMMFGEHTAEAEAQAMLDVAREAGLNAVDTADVYCGGDSERMLGRLIKAHRERWVVATKVANPIGSEPNDKGLSRRWLVRAVDASLQRLGTDWIDLYYMHRDDDTTPMEETLATMALLIERGKILYYGVSNFRAWRVAQMVETARRMGVPAPIACQPPYSLVTRGIETEVLPACAHYGLGVVSYSPLARGVLSGKYAASSPGPSSPASPTRGAGAGPAASALGAGLAGAAVEPPSGSRAARADKRLMQTEWRPESLNLAQAFKEHAAARGVSPAQLAIAWALHNRLIHGVIGGPRTLAQWQDYVAALVVRITPEDEAWVQARVPAGYASTFGYTDPIYPVTGRVVAA